MTNLILPQTKIFQGRTKYWTWKIRWRVSSHKLHCVPKGNIGPFKNDLKGFLLSIIHRHHMNTQTTDHPSSMLVQINPNDSPNEPVELKTKTKTPANDMTLKKRKKAAVDPNAPKRACSAFLLFSQAERAVIKRDQPDTPSTVMLQLLGERWQAADADTKAKYVAMHAENKIKADEARRVYAAEAKTDESDWYTVPVQ